MNEGGVPSKRSCGNQGDALRVEMERVTDGRLDRIVISHCCGDAIEKYREWPSPTVIISDGPYGVSGYNGDLHSENGLDKWYEPHIEKWTNASTPLTSLWFWNSEVGWATVHPVLVKHGWEYKACNIWDKGMGHVAGNCNTKTIRNLPVVSEVCVHYVKRASFEIDGMPATMQEWLIHEWKRSEIPFKQANEACGVVDAATRKWMGKDRLWYMPPSDAFQKLAAYANENGREDGRPYFSIDGVAPLTGEEWSKMRAKFYCPLGKTNVWSLPQLKGEERLKEGGKVVHNNQKPLCLIKDIISMCSDAGDVVWDPFGGLATAAIASIDMGRSCYSSEIDTDMFRVGRGRIASHIKEPRQFSLGDF